MNVLLALWAMKSREPKEDDLEDLNPSDWIIMEITAWAFLAVLVVFSIAVVAKEFGWF